MTSTYHHGDLRRAAIEAATVIVREGGAAALTTRAVAMAVGVSHPALYRHFAGRDALLDAVAAGWLDAVVDRLAATDGDLERFVASYVDAAVHDPKLYRCVFVVAGDGEAPATREALARLRRAAAAAYHGRHGVEGDALRDGVLRLWGTVHGMLDLYWHGLVRARTPQAAARYVADAALSRHGT